MKLKENSITARLYKWFYNVNQLPQSLCPYFWKLVLMGLLIIPYVIASAPVLIWSIFEKDADGVSIGEKLGVSFIIYCGIVASFCLLSPILLIWFDLPKDKGLDTFITGSIRVGLLLWVIVIIAVIVWSISWLVNNRKGLFRKKYAEHDHKLDTPTGRMFYLNSDGGRVYFEPKKYILIEFIKGTYNKYCPKIEWTNE